jgi:hypothetical protein
VKNHPGRGGWNSSFCYAFAIDLLALACKHAIAVFHCHVATVDLASADIEDSAGLLAWQFFSEAAHRHRAKAPHTLSSPHGRTVVVKFRTTGGCTGWSLGNIDLHESSLKINPGARIEVARLWFAMEQGFLR